MVTSPLACFDVTFRRRTCAVALTIIAAAVTPPRSANAFSDAAASDTKRAPDAASITREDVDRAIEKAVAFLWSRQRRDGRWVSRELEKEHPDALTALAAYTLRSSGATASDWRLRRAAAAVQERTKRTHTVFARSWTLLLWCSLDPVKYKRQIEEDIRFLNLKQAQGGGWGDRAPGSTGQGELRMDHATSQIALLALSEAASVGVDVFPRMWRREEEGWLGSANADGGWGHSLDGNPQAAAVECESCGVMTAAGVASLYLIYDQRYLDVALPFNGRFKARCGRESEKTRAIREAMDRGWRWLDRNYRTDAACGLKIEDGPELRKTSPAYRLHTISRAGMVSGRKRIGPNVWCHDVARQLVGTQERDGSWGSVNETCFGVLALLNAHTPVLINKLAFGTDDLWNTDPRDAANLTRWLGRRWGTPITWQMVELGSLFGDIYDAPVLLMSGHEAPTLDEEQRSRLCDFVHAGGTILAVACCSRPAFVEGCRELFTAMFPRFEYGPIPEDHPVWAIREAVKPEEDCLGFRDGCRTSIFVLTNGACCAWQQNLFNRYERLFALAGNIATYATFSRPPHGRLAPYFDTSTGTAEQSVSIARLKHRGDWWINPSALRNLSGALSKRIGLGLDERPTIAASNARRSRASVLWLTGHTFEPFRSAGRVELKAYLAAGGTLVASACCGREAFDASFQAFASTLYGRDAWRQIEPQDPIMTGSFAPELARPLSGLAYRERYGAPPPSRLDWPILYGIQRDGRWVVIYSPYDIHCGVSDHNCPHCVGYTTQDSKTIAANILLYTVHGLKSREQDRPAGKPVPQTTSAFLTPPS